jgi:amino acid transporter
MRLSRDVEMADFRPKEDSVAQGSVLSMPRGSAYSYANDPRHAHPVRRWLDSFRRDPNVHVTPPSVVHTAEDRRRASMATTRRSDDLPSRGARESRGPGGIHYFDLHAANVGTANTLLSRELKGRHLQMIAIGGSIGRWLTCRHLHMYSYDQIRLTWLTQAPGCSWRLERRSTPAAQPLCWWPTSLWAAC